MAHSNQLKPNHKAIQHYYETLQTFSDQKVTHEGATETAFSRLLADSAHAHGWTLIPKLPMRVGAKHIAPDGTVKDEFNLKLGYRSVGNVWHASGECVRQSLARTRAQAEFGHQGKGRHRPLTLTILALPFSPTSNAMRLLATPLPS
jgi:hypothetical protein